MPHPGKDHARAPAKPTTGTDDCGGHDDYGVARALKVKKADPEGIPAGALNGNSPLQARHPTV